MKIEFFNHKLDRNKIVGCNRSHSLGIELTSENWRPRTVLPFSSNGGDQSAMAMQFGMTRTSAPLTPDLAGNPTVKANSPE